MVSLFEIQQQRTRLRTGLSFDKYLPHGTKFEFQGIPGSLAPCIAAAGAIRNHLNLPHTLVLVIETLNRFPIELVERGNYGPEGIYDPKWVSDGRLNVVYCPTFAAVLAAVMGARSKSMVIIVDFHELCEQYRAQLSASQEEALLKHQIEVNSTLIDHIEQIKTEGTLPVLPKLAPKTDLVRESPFRRFESHLQLLLSSISNICLFLGCLDTVYEQIGGSSQFSQRIGTQSSSPVPVVLPQVRKLTLGSGNSVLSKYMASRLFFYRELENSVVQDYVQVTNLGDDMLVMVKMDNPVDDGEIEVGQDEEEEEEEEEENNMTGNSGNNGNENLNVHDADKGIELREHTTNLPTLPSSPTATL